MSVENDKLGFEIMIKDARSHFLPRDRRLAAIDVKIRALHSEIDELTEERRQLWNAREAEINRLTDALDYEDPTS